MANNYYTPTDIEELVLCDHRCPERNKLGQGVYECQCDCGRTTKVCGACLTAGRRTDCGCVAAKAAQEAI